MKEKPDTKLTFGRSMVYKKEFEDWEQENLPRKSLVNIIISDEVRFRVIKGL
jgi:hypothetical protein